MIPEHVRPLFWDIDVEGFEPARYPRYTIGRVLEWGDERAFLREGGAPTRDLYYADPGDPRLPPVLERRSRISRDLSTSP